jgi:hypothetical protein
LFFSFNKIEQKKSEDSSAKATAIEVDSAKKDTRDTIAENHSLRSKKEPMDISMNEKNSSEVKYVNFSLSLPSNVNEMIKNKVTAEQYLAQQKMLPKEKRAGYIERILTARLLQLNRNGEEGKREYVNKVLESFFHNMPKVFFFLLPWFAFLLYLLYFRHKQYYYVDHAILSLHYFSFIFLILVVGNYVLGKIFNTDIFTNLSVLWILVWLFIAMKRIYGQGWWKTLFKFSILWIVFFFSVLLTIFMNLAWSAFMI